MKNGAFIGVLTAFGGALAARSQREQSIALLAKKRGLTDLLPHQIIVLRIKPLSAAICRLGSKRQIYFMKTVWLKK